MDRTTRRYDIELDVPERLPRLADREAVALLRAEFRRALNASHFIALSADDPEIAVESRAVLAHGVARYALTLEFVARRALSDERAIALVHSEFQRAFNDAHFMRLAVEDPAVGIRARHAAEDRRALSWAA